MTHNNVHCATCCCGSLPNTPNIAGSTWYHRIDQQIQALCDQLQSLKSQRNALAPINRRLPHEILLNVFHSVLALDLTTPTFLTLARITSVCAHWRTIAIKAPTLWTILLSPMTRKHIGYVLERSRPLPLFVSLRPKSAYSLDLDISAVASRLQRLDASAPFYYMEDVLKMLEVVDEWPLLENMSLESKLSMPNEILICNAPALSTISLINIRFRIPPGSYSATLRHFTAHYYEDGGAGDNRSLAKWLDFFAAVPNLETLDLDYPLPDETSEFDERVVPLPSLRRFIFRETDINGPQFLQHLAIPAGATIDITFYVYLFNTVEEGLEPISSVIKHLVESHNASTPLRALTLHSNPDDKSVGFSFPSLCDPLWLPKPSMFFGIIFDEGDHDIIDSTLIRTAIYLKSAMSACRLTELVMNCPPSLALRALQDYKWVDTLTLFGTLGIWLLKKLLEQEQEDRISALSNIHTLVLHGVPLHWIKRHELLEFLEVSSIHTVRIEMSTGVLEEDIDVLREKMNVVIWNTNGDA